MTRIEYRVEEHDKSTKRYIDEQTFRTYEYAKQYAYETEDVYCVICKVTVEEIIEEVENVGEPAEEPKKELTPKEIKKAWETMKKNLKKEFADGLFDYGFVMNKTQIANRTATKTVCNTGTIDEEIESQKAFIENAVKWYKPEDYEIVKKNHTEYIEYLEACKQEYGTQRNRAEAEKKTLEESQAFAQFKNTVGDVKVSIEIDSDNFYRLRFNY